MNGGWTAAGSEPSGAERGKLLAFLAAWQGDGAPDAR